MTPCPQVIRYVQICVWVKYSHILAIQYTTWWCYDCHPGSDFNLSSFFLGDSFMNQLEEDDLENATMAKHKCQPQYCVKEDQTSLFNTLLTWQNEALDLDLNSFAQPATWIIDNKGLNLLSKLHLSDIYGQKTIVDLLQETPEWANKFAQQIFNIIRQFDWNHIKNAIHNACLAKQAQEHPAAMTLHEL